MASKKRCVFGCDDLGAYMHRFPNPKKYAELFSKWVSIVGEKLQEKDEKKIFITKKVCDYHFAPCQKVTGHRLLYMAVPTLHLQGISKNNAIDIQLEHNYSLPRMNMDGIDMNTNVNSSTLCQPNESLQTNGKVLTLDEISSENETSHSDYVQPSNFAKAQQYRALDSDNSGTASAAEGTVLTVSSVMNIQTEISHATEAFAPKVSPPSPLSTAERYEELIKSYLGNEALLNACAIKESPPKTPVSTADYNKIFIRNTLDSEPHFNASTPQTDPLDVGLKEDVSAKIDPEDTEIATFSRIGIRNLDPMSDEQMQSVHYALNRAIMKIGRKEAGPRFTGFIHMQGWILVNCANQVSQDWIVQKIDYLKPWPQAKLSVIPEDELPQVQVGTIFVPRSEAESPEEGFQLLRAQNDGLNTELWKILRCRDEVHGFLVTLSLDNPSADAIRMKGCRVALGFKFVTFKIYGQSDTKYESDLNRY